MRSDADRLSDILDAVAEIPPCVKRLRCPVLLKRQAYR
jgi:hypothetical protein